MTSPSNHRRAVAFLAPVPRLAALIVLTVGALAASAQTGRPVTSGTPDATRAELTNRLDSLVRIDSTQGNATERRDRSNEVSAIRHRLEDGDLRSGDRFLVEFGLEQKRDTVFVREGNVIALMNWQTTSVRGVLRSELQPALERYIGTYVREPRVRVYPLTRIAINGAVGRPGYYAVDPSAPLSDAITAAGGPTQAAQYDKITIYRATERLMEAKQVTRALKDGQTVDQLGLQSGDEVRVADRKPRNWAPIIQASLIGVTAFSAILALIRSSYSY